jgi:NAD(P)-dependent dehydrogenase (short-subunit alcohol dehydrogenase family)
MTIGTKTTSPHIIIVGAGPGIGVGVARAFGATGFAVSLLARGQRNLDEATSALTETGADVAAFVADAAHPESLRVAIQAALARFGAADALLYNAVSFSQGLPTTVDPASLTRDFNVNVVGALVAAQAVLPSMRREGRGTLLFTGGGYALHPDPAFASLGIGKGALRTLVMLLARELEGSGIRVSTLTIMGLVKSGSAFDPEGIGRAFLELYQKPADAFPVEVQFRGLP